MSPFWLKYIYSVLSAFTWCPMPPVACSILCSKDSARVGVFARNAVICIVCVRNCFFCVSSASCLFFFSVKPFSFIRSIDFRSTQSKQIIYSLTKYQQQCHRNLSPPAERTKTFALLSLWLWLYAKSIVPSSLCVWNQMPWRNLRKSMLTRVFLHKPLLSFDRWSESLMLGIDFSENHFDSF